MALNKRGKVEIGTVLVWILIVGVVAYVANFGGFQSTVNGFFGGMGGSNAPAQSGSAAPVLTDTKDCPTDGTTTYTINVQDALTTTATSLYPEYYIFNGNQLIKEGTLSSTASTVSVSCGKDYKVLLVNTTANTGSYAKIIDLKARIAQQTVNEKMIQYGGAKIYNIINPADNSRIANISIGASTTKAFEIQFGANVSQKGYNKPIIMCQVNITSITGVVLSSFDDGSKPVVVSALPKRVSANAGYQYYAWEYPKMIDMTMSTIVAKGSITSGSTAPGTTDSMACKLVDQATWKTASYKTATSIDEGFKTGPENSENLLDVGAPDSSVAYLYFVNANGV